MKTGRPLFIEFTWGGSFGTDGDPQEGHAVAVMLLAAPVRGSDLV